MKYKTPVSLSAGMLVLDLGVFVLTLCEWTWNLGFQTGKAVREIWSSFKPRRGKHAVSG